jgi:hypothetical protein
LRNQGLFFLCCLVSSNDVPFYPLPKGIEGWIESCTPTFSIPLVAKKGDICF